MIRLFSSFDTHFFSFRVLTLIFCFYMLISNYKVNIHITSIQLFELLLRFFYSLKPNDVRKFSIMIFVRVFVGILSFNFLSVFSFVFPVTSFFGVIIFFSLVSWGIFIFFIVSKNFGRIISHFVPEGSPLGLVPVLFLIEIVRRIIRPITLTVRLVANILAGHLLIILLSNLVFLFPYSFILYIFLNFLEFFVALIQRYIFCTIITLYYREVH